MIIVFKVRRILITSTNIDVYITFFYFGKTISVLLGNFSTIIRYRNPCACKNRRTSISGLVSFPLMRLILKLRVVVSCTSAIDAKILVSMHSGNRKPTSLYQNDLESWQGPSQLLGTYILYSRHVSFQNQGTGEGSNIPYRQDLQVSYRGGSPRNA